MNLNKRNFLAALCICSILSVFGLHAQNETPLSQQIEAATPHTTCDFVNLSTVCPRALTIKKDFLKLPL